MAQINLPPGFELVEDAPTSGGLPPGFEIVNDEPAPQQAGLSLPAASAAGLALEQAAPFALSGVAKGAKLVAKHPRAAVSAVGAVVKGPLGVLAGPLAKAAGVEGVVQQGAKALAKTAGKKAVKSAVASGAKWLGPAGMVADAAMNWDEYQAERARFDDEARQAAERMLLLQQLGLGSRRGSDIELPTE